MVGSIITAEELLVHGRVEGDIRAAKIVVCAGGVVKGHLTADVIIIHGAVEGRIDGHDVMLCGEASVNAEITHHTLGIDRTAGFEGSVKRVPTAEPDAAALDQDWQVS
jgi:cytoskeletal protein CcmA (bactofilin family)